MPGSFSSISSRQFVCPYWFSRSHVQRSRSNHSFEPTMLSAQYLLTPSLDQYQTWCRGCPQRVDDPYWFSRSHVQRSRSNHSSQPMVLSAQYLLTPSLDLYKTWCRGCPQWVDDSYWFSSHMFKGQGQTTLLGPMYCPLNIFWPLHLINTKLGAGVAPTK